MQEKATASLQMPWPFFHTILRLLSPACGLFLTYVGLNLLYRSFGTSPYVVYSALAIISTTVGVGFFYLKEPVNAYHVAAVLLALTAVALFSIGQSKL